MRNTLTFSVKNTVPNLSELGQKNILFLNSNSANKPNILAIGAHNNYILNNGTEALTFIKHFTSNNNDWLFGYISYDLKNQLEDGLSSDNEDKLLFPLFHFWQPKVVFTWLNNKVTAHCLSTEIADLNLLVDIIFNSQTTNFSTPLNIALNAKISKEEYLLKIAEIKQHIASGNIYEMNFCQEFYAENVQIEPYSLYKKLNQLTEAPFSAYLQDGERYLLCASPERFLKKEGEKLITSPIKGTLRKSDNPTEDEALKEQLQSNAKDKAENVMIVDLVRNDLSKLAKQGTVNVDELQAIYSFKTVHQMVSTVSCKLKPEIKFHDIIKATFPMGSMTGAPKIKAMQLAEAIETTKRGIYSGTIGYFEPNGNFEFNVVIRSLAFNKKASYASLMVGGAITNLSVAEDEYAECLLKADAILKALKS